MESIAIEDFPQPSRLPRGRRLYRVRMTRMRDGTHLEIPCAVLKRRQRPLVCVVGGLHGDEWNGIYVADQLSRHLDPREMLGTVIVLPVTNPFAFYERRRVAAADSVDLNRAFGLEEPRKPTELLASFLFENLLIRADAIVELHAGGPGEYVPLVMAPTEVLAPMARSLGLPYVLLGETKRHSLAHEAVSREVPALTLQVGQARSVDPAACSAAEAALINLLRHVGVLPGEPRPAQSCTVFSDKIVIPAPCAGFFECQVPLGAQVREGETIGRVAPLLEDRVEVAESPIDGTLIYLRREAAVDERDSLAHIAF
jgi:predicted deacylase